MFKIQIPGPCHEDWNKMTPTNGGAYCRACYKEVIDFTTMSDEEVQQYFLNQTGGNPCGIFRPQQLHPIPIHLPENLFIQKIAGWKKFMAVVLLAFGSMLFGCDVHVNNQITEKTNIASANKTMEAADNFKSEMDRMVLGVALPNNISFVTKKDSVPEVIALQSGEVMEDISITRVTIRQVLPDTFTIISAIDTSDNIFAGKMIPDTLKSKPLPDSTGCDKIGFY